LLFFQLLIRLVIFLLIVLVDPYNERRTTLGALGVTAHNTPRNSMVQLLVHMPSKSTHSWLYGSKRWRYIRHSPIKNRNRVFHLIGADTDCKMMNKLQRKR